MTKTLLKHERIPIRHLLLVGWLPSPLKKLVYRIVLRYRIGRNVKLAFGSAIVGRSVEIGDHVELGFFSVLMGNQIRIGRHSKIGTMSYLACPRIEIGEDAKIKEQVFIGGPELPESSFRLGSRTVILQRTSINPTKPVEIGDDSGIGGHCLIFTHGSWLSALQGYPVTFEPVTIGKSVWLPWRVFVMPGATIGDGTVIGANSLVSGAIPPSALAVGSPARVIKQFPDFPTALDSQGRANTVATVLEEFERYMKSEDIDIRDEGPSRIFERNGKGFRLVRFRSDSSEPPAVSSGDTLLAETRLSDHQLERFRARGVHWLDLDGNSRSSGGSPLTEELAEFLGRYGIRLVRDSMIDS